VIARTDVAYAQHSGGADRRHAWPVFLLEERGVPLAFCQIIASRSGDDDARVATSRRYTSCHSSAARGTAEPWWLEYPESVRSRGPDLRDAMSAGSAVATAAELWQDV